ncbi:MAG: RNA-directed DNA polymerase [Planctomycetaceae bacterium]|nr:RNA-directed DNA polymerase [Planctomycetaceae bacterium]
MSFSSVWRAVQRFFAGGRTLNDLGEWLDMPLTRIKDVPLTYYEFKIPKRSGGQRRILAPNDKLKRLQRRIHRRLLRRLKSHSCATGFEDGQSIVDNAVPHLEAAVIVKLDIVDFFPSIQFFDVQGMFRRRGWGRSAASLLAEICTHEDVLPQGAPTSPKLSNLVNKGLDQALDNIADCFCANYTRYADDVTFSFARDDDPDQVRDLLYNVRGVIGRFGYEVHHRRKLSVRRQHQRQEVTGLVVNGERPRLPRETRRWLRAVRHRVATRGYGTLTAEQLAGWESLERMIEQSGTSRPIPE